MGAPFSLIELFRNIIYYRKLQKEGVTTQAKIVGKEWHDGGDSADDYYVFFQFRPDFVVKYSDNTPDYTYYNQPEGSEIKVLYLPANPRINIIEF
ncbi:MAG TPA: hypothetical protein PKD70_15595 [Saprospiraceae bacterium]|nr:hypothetical protein [Saprospiraceae bacterium]HMP15302.1 hypothetical protein [Saprospiraceae bacterium]